MDNETIEKNKIVHTFSDDVVGALGENQGGGVRQLIEAEEAQEKEKKDYSPSTLKNKIFVLIGILLIAASVAGVAYVVLNKQDETVSLPERYKPMVYADHNEFIPIDELQKSAVGPAIFWQSEKRKIKPGQLTGLYLTENKQVVDLPRFFSAIGGHSNPKTFEYLDSNYTLGIDVLKDGRKHVFLLISAKNFQDVFPLFKEWEKSIFADLYSMFGINLTADNYYLLEKEMSDGIIQNKNARILSDEAGDIVLAYVYLDQNNILITNSEDVVRDIALRMKSNTESR